jgi:hypothetical protein
VDGQTFHFDENALKSIQQFMETQAFQTTANVLLLLIVSNEIDIGNDENGVGLGCRNSATLFTNTTRNKARDRGGTESKTRASETRKP